MADVRLNAVPRPPGVPSNVCGDYGNLNRFGKPCKNWCIPGGRACRRHTGSGVKKERDVGALNLALQEWGIRPGEVVDPGETFLALIAQSSRRVQRYAELLGTVVMKAAQITAVEDGRETPARSETVEDLFAHGELAGLLGPAYALDMFGNRIQIGEQIRALTKLEAEERDRLASWCQKAIAAGLEERRVRMAEQQGAQLAAVIRAFVGELGLTVGQREQIPRALRLAVEQVFGVAPARMVEGSVVAA